MSKNMVETPCTVGDTVYWPSTWKSGVLEGEVKSIIVYADGFVLNIRTLLGRDVKKYPAKVFSTREEAAAALAKMSRG